MKLKNLFASDPSGSNTSMEEEAEFCCGKHAICKKNLPPRSSPDPVEYYDDEELDVFKNRSADTYTEEETEQFMEIFKSLWITDVLDWKNSLHLRGIELPVSLQSNPA
jgi:hypothetical protein